MNKLFAIKEEFKSTIIGFNGSGLPLGERNDLDKLAEMALQNPALANLFVSAPNADQIKAFKEQRLLDQTRDHAAQPAAEPTNTPGNESHETHSLDEEEEHT